MTSETKNLRGLFLDGLKDIYYAENQILQALPDMAEGAYTEEATAAFEKHRVETEGQVERLEQVFQLFGETPTGKECPAIDGILAEGDAILEEYAGTPALDAGLVAAAQAVEHYEIARYGTLVAWATLLGMPEAAELLDEIREQEIATDDALTALAENGGINDMAIGDDAETDDEETDQVTDAVRQLDQVQT